MIVSEELNYVFCEVPRTASTSVAAFLIKEWKGMEIVSPNLLIPAKHSMRIPSKYRKRNTCVWMMVRNPFDRCRSMWAYMCNDRNATGFRMGWYGTSFEYFMREMIKYSKSAVVPDHTFPFALKDTQKAYHDMIKPTHIIHYENMGAIHSLPFVEYPRNIPHKNRSIPAPKGKTVAFTWNKERVNLVLEYCWDDFELGGYTTESYVGLKYASKAMMTRAEWDKSRPKVFRGTQKKKKGWPKGKPRGRKKKVAPNE